MYANKAHTQQHSFVTLYLSVCFYLSDFTYCGVKRKKRKFLLGNYRPVSLNKKVLHKAILSTVGLSPLGVVLNPILCFWIAHEALHGEVEHIEYMCNFTYILLLLTDIFFALITGRSDIVTLDSSAKHCDFHSLSTA